MDKFVIHLSERSDRLADIEKLKGFYPDLRIFDAIKHERGYIGLSMSYRAIFQEQLEKGAKYCLTFEDDAVISKAGVDHFEECLQTAPAEWDTLLGGAYHIHKPSVVNENWIKAKDFGGTQMVLWSRSGMVKAMSHQPENGTKPYDIDKYLNYEQRFVSYICQPMVCRQTGSPSSIRPGSCYLDSKGNWLV